MKIVNKIITFLGAAAVFPVLITQTFASVILSVDKESLAYSFLNVILGQDNQITGSRLGIQKSLVDFFDYITGKTTSTIDFKKVISSLPAEAVALKKYVIAALILVAVGVLITIVIMGTALFTNAYKTIIGLSLGGAASFLAAIVVFGKAARPFLDGTIDVASSILPLLINGESVLGSLASAAISGAVSVDSLGLGGAVYGAMIALFAVAVWEFAYYITIPKEDKAAKKVKA